MIVLVAVLVVVIAAIAIAATIGRRRRGLMPRPAVAIDPFTVGEPWRRHVAAAQTAQRRYDATVATIAPGPLRDRLVTIGTQLRRGVAECGQIARRGDELDDTLRRLDAPSITRRLERADDDESRRSLENQLAAAARIRSTRDAADSRLRTLDARLGELVAGAAELGAGSDATGASGDELGGAVDDVVTELEALRLAIADVDHAGGAPPAACFRASGGAPEPRDQPAAGVDPTDSGSAGTSGTSPAT